MSGLDCSEAGAEASRAKRRKFRPDASKGRSHAIDG
jgi:hypothetical protein